MAEIISVSDLPSSIQQHELIDTLVAGANAKASRVAPCLDSENAASDDQIAEAKMVLIGAVKRWTEAGSGALQAQNAGPFGLTVDTRQRGGFNLWPSEITDLQAICAAAPTGRESFSIDTAPGGSDPHADICSLHFDASYCSCGSDINGGDGPLYEQV